MSCRHRGIGEALGMAVGVRKRLLQRVPSAGLGSVAGPCVGRNILDEDGRTGVDDNRGTEPSSAFIAAIVCVRVFATSSSPTTNSVNGKGGMKFGTAPTLRPYRMVSCLSGMTAWAHGGVFSRPLRGSRSPLGNNGGGRVTTYRGCRHARHAAGSHMGHRPFRCGGGPAVRGTGTAPWSAPPHPVPNQDRPPFPGSMSLAAARMTVAAERPAVSSPAIPRPRTVVRITGGPQGAALSRRTGAPAAQSGPRSPRA